MEIEYLSDDEQRGKATKDCQSSDGAFYYCDSIFYDQYVKVESTVDDNLHQIINYPQLEKHTTNKIVSICNEIDLIDFAIDNHVSKPIIKSIISPIIKLKTKPIKRLKKKFFYR